MEALFCHHDARPVRGSAATPSAECGSDAGNSRVCAGHADAPRHHSLNDEALALHCATGRVLVVYGSWGMRAGWVRHSVITHQDLAADSGLFKGPEPEPWAKIYIYIFSGKKKVSCFRRFYPHDD